MGKLIDFLTSEQEYLLARAELRHILKVDVDIVDNPFISHFKIFKGFEFDKIYGESFYQGLIKFLTAQKEVDFKFYTLQPDPVTYFYHHFTKYSVGRIPITASHSDYWNFLDADPGNPADALLSNAETIALYSNTPSWGIIGSRDLEIGILGFKDDATEAQFINCFVERVFMDIATRIGELNEMNVLSLETQRIYSKMMINYF